MLEDSEEQDRRVPILVAGQCGQTSGPYVQRQRATVVEALGLEIDAHILVVVLAQQTTHPAPAASEIEDRTRRRVRASKFCERGAIERTRGFEDVAAVGAVVARPRVLLAVRPLQFFRAGKRRELQCPAAGTSRIRIRPAIAEKCR